MWPGENGTVMSKVPPECLFIDSILDPLKSYLRSNYPRRLIELDVAQVWRKRFIRGDVRYKIRRAFAVAGMRPPNFMMRV